MKHMTFKEYVDRRDNRKDEVLDWIPHVVHSMPLWGWAASAAGVAALAALNRWAKNYARDKQELREMAHWSHVFNHLIEKHGPDSEEVERHMKMTEHKPYSYLKGISETHLRIAREEAAKQKEKDGGEDLLNKYDYKGSRAHYLKA